MKNVFNYLIVAAGMSSMVMTANANDTTKAMKKGVENVQTKVYDIVDKDVTTVSFSKGSTAVTETEKTDLRALVRSVQGDTKIDQIVVAAWSDKDLPTTGRQDLSAEDQKLATQRADNVKKVLADMGAPGVKTYSMATSPSWIAEVFGTTQSQVKNSVKGAQTNDASVDKVASTLRSKGGPSTVVVYIKRQSNT